MIVLFYLSVSVVLFGGLSAYMYANYAKNKRELAWDESCKALSKPKDLIDLKDLTMQSKTVSTIVAARTAQLAEEISKVVHDSNKKKPAKKKARPKKSKAKKK